MDTYGYVQFLGELTADEGLRLKPYRDSVGKLTIGIGRNLDDVGISKEEALVLLRNDVVRAEKDLDRALPWWRTLSPARQRALLNMCFNLGIGDGVRGLTGFKNTLRMLREGRYQEAADNALKSKWAKQVGARAVRVTNLIRNG